ncbi:hypothetical protein A1O3_01842 [Capronia epimyces CBS 606.96]|uniref:BTB domain-containing protein n=1 Tax=Capronia epimyces CBS 606.96 TaxID=1182542 RepID=W9Y8B4_9EURO|nr:uncharacterized protein A1O3_01842 [Capronia epimyces CBS 606.96]EXJ88778.1 hypothetical protein A1O3_01842 [Capronia epimyces CBS 606.96]
MDIPHRDFAHSHPFQFLVGPEKRSIYIHSGLVQQHSQTLDTLVRGGMVEANEQCATLEDIDEETFIRFVEFAYTGDYLVPAPKLVVSLSADDGQGQSFEGYAGRDLSHRASVGSLTADDGHGQSFEGYDPWNPPKRALKKKAIVKKRQNLWVNYDNGEPEPAEGRPPKPPPEEVEFMAQHPGIWWQLPRESKAWREFKRKVQVRQTPAWEPRANVHPDEDYGPVFLSHASLYVFSDRYSIQALRELVLQKLRLTLSRFTLFPERTGDVVELLKYAYASTGDHDHGIDKLRDLVTDYITCEIRTIGTNPGFLEYLKEEGFAASDLMAKLVAQLDSPSEDR